VLDLAILAVGKLRPFYRDACDEYARRLRRYALVRELEIRESRQSGNRAAAERDEGRRLVEKLPPRSVLVALTRDGAAWSSAQLSARLDRWLQEGRPVAFVIGGSTGLDAEVLDRANQHWSLGPLTLPHELARVIVYEQLYRGFTILRGEPYHKGRG
jgi:23S rRNA (pseudouridine1915-N3)-methyltransferase